MKRKIIRISEEKCNGCGICIPNCQEGALQIIDGKARLISDLFCDGLGACIGHCPEGAIDVIEREAEPYDERKVMETLVPKGRNTVLAHLEHLRDHNETGYLDEAIKYLKENQIDMSREVSVREFKESSANVVFSSLPEARQNLQAGGCGGGCPSALPVDFQMAKEQVEQAAVRENIGINAPSELRQWPVQLHLLNPQASYFRDAEVLLAADCVAFSMGNFHARFLKGKSLAIACPKLDTNKESYIQKLTSMIADTEIRSLTVVMMEVPCCGGLLGMAQIARKQAGRHLPVKKVIVGIRGEVLTEELV